MGVLVYSLFAGQYYDAETGHDYNYFRDYDPATGRYIESDPIGLAGGLNTYGYVYQNPYLYADPYGRIGATATLEFVGGGISELVPIPGFRAVGAILITSAMVSADTNTDEAQRQAEYEKAKSYCDTPPPPGDNECATLSIQIDHAQQCIDMYEAWDNKWLPGRHSTKIQEWRNRLQSLKEEHKSKCTNKCSL